MSIWCPAPTIRFKALGLPWRDERLLAVDVTDDTGRVKGVRPLGGTIAFGERAEPAVARESAEEIGLAVTMTGSPRHLENICVHEGETGHEVVALHEVTFLEPELVAPGRFCFLEDNGETCWSDGFALDALEGPGRPALFPTGLMSLLRGAT